MKRFLKTIGPLCGALVLTTGIYAQDAEIGVGGGGLLYQGDLVPQHVDVSQTSYAVGAFYRYYYNPRLNSHIQLTVGQIRGADSLIEVMDVNSHERAERNLDFLSRVIMLRGGVDVNLFPYINGMRQFSFTPYLLVRVGAVYYEPTRTIDGVTLKLRTINPEGHPWKPVALTLSYGAGVKYSVASLWNVGLEIEQHFTSTDYLDGVSAVYRPDVAEMYRNGGADALKARAIVGYIDYYKNKRGYSEQQIVSFLENIENIKRGDPSHDWMVGLQLTVSRTLRPCNCEIFKNLF